MPTPVGDWIGPLGVEPSDGGPSTANAAPAIAPTIVPAYNNNLSLRILSSSLRRARPTGLPGRRMPCRPVAFVTSRIDRNAADRQHPDPKNTMLCGDGPRQYPERPVAELLCRVWQKSNTSEVNMKIKLHAKFQNRQIALQDYFRRNNGTSDPIPPVSLLPRIRGCLAPAPAAVAARFPAARPALARGKAGGSGDLTGCAPGQVPLAARERMTSPIAWAMSRTTGAAMRRTAIACVVSSAGCAIGRNTSAPRAISSRTATPGRMVQPRPVADHFLGHRHAVHLERRIEPQAALERRPRQQAADPVPRIGQDQRHAGQVAQPHRQRTLRQRVRRAT